MDERGTDSGPSAAEIVQVEVFPIFHADHVVYLSF